MFIFDREEDKISYDKIKVLLKDFHYADIHGESSFLRIFIEELIDDNVLDIVPPGIYEKIYNYVMFMRDAYALPELENYFNWIINDCLLGMEKYEEYLEKTRPTNIDYTDTQGSNLRLNLQEHIHLPADPVDIILTFGAGRKSSFIKMHLDTYRKALYNTFNDYLGKRNTWFDVFKEWGCHNPIYDHYLLQIVHCVSLPRLAFKISCFYSAYGRTNEIKALVRNAEDLARQEMGIPKIGEGWTTETALFHRICQEFPETEIIHHGHPKWLHGQHFDIWLPEWRIAVEYNGIQHYKPIDFFGGMEGYQKNIERDRRKQDLSKRHRTKLIIVNDDDNIEELIQTIKNLVAKKMR
jgi:hypothetical protein